MYKQQLNAVSGKWPLVVQGGQKSLKVGFNCSVNVSGKYLQIRSIYFRCLTSNDVYTATISETYSHIFEALSHIHNDDTEKGNTRRQAQDLLQKMDELEFVFMLHLWTALLKQFHKVSNALQSTQILLTTCRNLYSSLLQFVSGLRENFDEIDKHAKAVLPDVEQRSSTVCTVHPRVGCTKICVGCTTKKGFTKVHHKLVTPNK